MRRSLKRRAPIRRAILSNRRAIRTLKADKEVKYLVGALYPDSSTELPLAANGPSGQIVNRAIYVNSEGWSITSLGVANGYSVCPDLLPSAKGVAAQGIVNPGGSPHEGARIGREIKLKSLSVKIKCYLPMGQTGVNYSNGNVLFHAMLVLDRQPTIEWNPSPQSNVNLAWQDFKETTLADSLQDPGSDAMMWNTRDPAFRQRFKVIKKASRMVSRQQVPRGVTDQQLPTLAGSITNVLAAGPATLPTVPVDFPGTYLDRNDHSNHTSRMFGEITLMVKHPYKFKYPIDAAGVGLDYQLPENHTIRLLCWTEPKNILAQDVTTGYEWQQQIAAFTYMTKVRFTDD